MPVNQTFLTVIILDERKQYQVSSFISLTLRFFLSFFLSFFFMIFPFSLNYVTNAFTNLNKNQNGFFFIIFSQLLLFWYINL